MKTESAILSALQHDLSAPIARSIIARMKRVLDVRSLDGVDKHILADHLESSVRVFLEPAKLQELGARIRQSVRRVPQSELRVDVAHGGEITEAVAAARTLCDELGCDPLTRRRAVVVVAELARNIAQYTDGGHIDLLADGAECTLEVVARDRGPGIEDADALLAASRERGGLKSGLGILQHATSRFDLDTSEDGTTVRALIDLRPSAAA